MHLFQSYFYKYRLLYFIPFVFTTTLSQAQPKEEKLDQLVKKYSDYDQFNGSILVAKEGNVLYKKGFGYANFEWKIPNQTNTKFRLASITKQFTAALILKLAAEGKINLNTPISTYLPNYPKKIGNQVTTHHLLTHTSGIPNYTSFPNYREVMRQPHSTDQLVATFSDSTLSFEPGKKFQYSNSGYAILGELIEKVTNLSFEQALQEKIFRPLKMNNSGYDSHHKILQNRASGYWMNGGSYVNANFIDMSVAFSAGGLYSTVEDMLLWDQALYTEEILPQKFLDLMFKKHIPAWGGHYGYGWNIEELQIGSSTKKVTTIQHSGSINGFSTIIVRIPSDRISIILLDNASNRSMNKIAQAIAGILYDKPYEFPKQSLANSLYKVIEKEGIQQGLLYYDKAKKEDNFYRDEGEINLVGYNLLQQGKLEAAVSVLEINAKTYTQSSNAYDSYGEALLRFGDTIQAIENYQRSLELNPNNINGLEILRSLGTDTEFYERLKSGLFDMKSAWRKEIFPLPVGFAPKISYKGIEEARFANGWPDKESEEFWTYLFAWYIEANTPLTVEELTKNLQFYFDGLMSVINKDKGDIPVKTNTSIQQITNNDQTIIYKGNIHFYDAFFTQKAITLNLQIDQQFCQQKNKSLIEFRFSPKKFSHHIWPKLLDVKSVTGICNE